MKPRQLGEQMMTRIFAVPVPESLLIFEVVVVSIKIKCSLTERGSRTHVANLMGIILESA